MLAAILALLFLNMIIVHGYGITATSDRFPYQASLRFYYNSDHHCSGTVIASRFVLTAGHCVCNNVKYYMLYISVGANTFVGTGYSYPIEKSICHEDFKLKNLRNDISLLKTTKNIRFNRRVRSAPLINFRLPRRGICLMSVWGYTKNPTYPPTNFRVVFAALIEREYCGRLFPSSMVNVTNICTITRGVGACIGDSGGPVMYKGHLVGIISFGRECIHGFPNVHTNIAEYVSWINEEMFFEEDVSNEK